MPALTTLIDLAAIRLVKAKTAASEAVVAARDALAKLHVAKDDAKGALEGCGLIAETPKELQQSTQSLMVAEAHCAANTYIDYVAATNSAKQSTEAANKGISTLEGGFRTKIESVRQTLLSQLARLPNEHVRRSEASNLSTAEYRQSMEVIVAAKEKAKSSKNYYQQLSLELQSLTTELHTWQRLCETIDQEKQRQHRNSRRIDGIITFLKSVTPLLIFVGCVWYCVNSIKSCSNNYDKSNEVENTFLGEWLFRHPVVAGKEDMVVRFRSTSRYSMPGHCDIMRFGILKDREWIVTKGGKELLFYGYDQTPEEHYDIIERSPTSCKMGLQNSDVLWIGKKRP